LDFVILTFSKTPEKNLGRTQGAQGGFIAALVVGLRKQVSIMD
jgi:hypothetical protein